VSVSGHHCLGAGPLVSPETVLHFGASPNSSCAVKTPPPLQLPCQPVSRCRCARRAQELTHTQGYERLDARRRMKHDKQIAAGVLMPKRGMDEGVDRRLAAR